MTGSRVGALLRNRIAQNAAALYASQFLLTVVPLITLPWIARALGAAELGEVLYVQSFAWVMTMINEYGFRLSGTRAVARVRDDPQRLADTVAGIVGAKLLLAGVVTLLSLLALVSVPRFREDPGLLLLGWAMGLAQGMEPLWFFAGVERLRMTAAMEATVRLLTAAAIILFIDAPGQGKLVLGIWLGGLALSTGVLTAIMYRLVGPRRPHLAASLSALREGWSLFVNSAAVTLYTSATMFLLGFVVSNTQLAVFGSAERVVRAAVRTLTPISQASYPRVTYLLEAGDEARAQRLASIALAVLTGVGLLMGAGLAALSPFIIDVLFGPAFAESVPIMRTLSLLLPLVAIASTLSGMWLIPRHLDGVALRTSLAAGLANVVLALVVGSVAGIQGAAWVLVGIEAGVSASLAFAIARRGLFPTRAEALGRV